MKRKRKFKAGVIVLVLLFSMLLPFLQTEETKAATSYSNAKEFYESTAIDGQNYHAEMVNGSIYYATCGKLASSSSNLKYQTLGFDIELSGNGHTVSIGVQRTGGSMTEINSTKENGYEYNLYVIDDDALFALASRANPTAASYVLSSSTIHVRMNAILTTKKGTSLHGGVSENGSGALIEWGTTYHLSNDSDLTKLKHIFSGHEFKSYMKIEEDLDNYLLQIRYGANGTSAANTSCSSTVTVGNGYRLVNYTENGITYPYLLYANGGLCTTSSRVLNPITLLNPSSAGMSKTGYHLNTGQEWITDTGVVLSANRTYMPKEIEPAVGYRNTNIFLYANWQPNTYSVVYNANGGTGSIASSRFSYDTSGTLRANTYTKTGYYLEPGAEWNTKADGTGTSYSSNEVIKNLSSTDGDKITLYANWKPIVVMISVDKEGGTGGTDSFYQKYATGFYKEYASINRISSLTTPSRTGYHFLGYYSTFYGLGTQIVNEKGSIQIPTTYYLKDSIIYANWQPKTYTVTLDKQGGLGGSNSVTATYDEVLPFAEAPIKTGYSFKGYYTKPNGQGEQYYNEFMVSDIIYQTDSDMTLYAYWVDETPPQTYLVANINEWTNREITLTTSAYDYGVGLSSLALYQNDVLVAEQTDLDGAKTCSFTFANDKEGVITYKAIATDLEGNTTEIYAVVKYDTKAPEGEVVEFILDDGKVTIIVDVTDINVQ